MISRTRRNKLRAHSFEISLTPLIDTTLVLLVIFMVATPIMYNSIKVELPKGHVKEDESASNDLIVSIKLDGDSKRYVLRYFLNQDEFNLDTLIKVLDKKVSNKRTQKVYVNADNKITYGDLVKVVDKIKYIGGIEHVILSTERA